MAKTRASKLSKLAIAPGHWSTVKLGVVPSVEHSRVPFNGQTATVFDVGASRGQFASFASQRFPSAKLICFEPLPEARAVLTQVVGDRATINPVAVGSAAGSAEINVSAHDDSSSLLAIGAKQVAEYPGTQRASTLEVDVVTLGDYDVASTPGPRLLKIDVQGFELDVLRGAGQNLALFDQAFVECSFVELYEGQALADEVIAFMLEQGLRFAGAFGISYSADGSAIQADLLFNR